MARLHEYQGKAILAANGFKIPRGRAAYPVKHGYDGPPLRDNSGGGSKSQSPNPPLP